MVWTTYGCPVRIAFQAQTPCSGILIGPLSEPGGTFLRAILPALSSSWSAQWSTEVFALDASEEGYGVCRTTWSKAQVSAIGTVREKSRFRLGPGKSARDAFFENAG